MTASILRSFLTRARATPDRVALRELEIAGAARDRTLTWDGWRLASLEVAAALGAGGLAPGGAVAILAGSRAAWPIADLGVLIAGGTSVGLYPSSAPAQVRQILADCAASLVIVDDAAQAAKVAAIRDALPAPCTIVSTDPDAARHGAIVWDAWLASGRDALAAEAGLATRLEREAIAVPPDALALLVYTSGSTGEPKGARLSHRYLAASAESVRETLGLTESDTTLSFLPYSHAAERIFGLYTRIHVGMEATLVPDHARLGEAARATGPTLFGGLPRFYERVFESLEAERLALRGDERARWDRALELGRARSALRQRGAPVPAALEAEWRTVGASAFARVRDHFGGRVRLATSGGASLPVEVAEHLDALGLTVLGAYGLTEHLCVAFNRPLDYRFDAAGPPMPGTELRIAEDGEVQVRRGALTFDGYHGRPDETRAAFTADGRWLRTGDLGAVDERGALRIVGRTKELIALSTGKKIAPLPIEAALLGEPWIAQAMLYGEGKKFLAALICLRRPLVEAWARERGLALPFPELLDHPEVLERVRAAVTHANGEVSRSEQVKQFLLLERELSLDEGELTPTMKVRRPVVAEKFRDRLEALYR